MGKTLTGVAAALGGAVVGAACMYLLDPSGGRRRRHRIRDRALRTATMSRRRITGKVRDLKNRGKGLVAEASAMLQGRLNRIMGKAHEQVVAGGSEVEMTASHPIGETMTPRDWDLMP